MYLRPRMTTTTTTHTRTATAITVPYKNTWSSRDGEESVVLSVGVGVASLVVGVSVGVGMVSLVVGVVTGTESMELHSPIEN